MGSHQSQLRADAMWRLQLRHANLGGAEVEQAEVADRATIRRLNGRRNWGVHKGDRTRLPGKAVSGGRAISEWVFREVRRECQIAGKSRKNASFLTFDAGPAASLRRWG